MPGPGAYWFGKEETEAVLKVIDSGYISNDSAFKEDGSSHLNVY